MVKISTKLTLDFIPSERLLCTCVSNFKNFHIKRDILVEKIYEKM